MQPDTTQTRCPFCHFTVISKHSSGSHETFHRPGQRATHSTLYSYLPSGFGSSVRVSWLYMVSGGQCLTHSPLSLKSSHACQIQHISLSMSHKKLSYHRETVLQGVLVLAKSGRMRLGDHILRTI